MKKTTPILFLCLAGMLSASAQKPLHPKAAVAEFAENPRVHPVPPEYAGEPAIILQNDVTLDYRFEGRNTNVYYTLHRLVKVLDEKGIESFNTIGITVSKYTRVPSIKVRTILPNGKVRDVAKDMIKVTQDESGHNKIVIALEGVERNAEIELLLKEIKPYSAFGTEYFQYHVPVVSGHLDISYPKDFVFEEKGYNGFPNVKDTLLNNRRHINVDVANVAGLAEEPYSYYNLYRMRAEYRVHNFVDNNENDQRNVYTWDDLGRRIYDEHYKITDKERAAVNNFLTELGVHAKGNELENIKKIENGIKSKIVLYEFVEGEKTDVLDSIISKRAATSEGYVKLFAACFAQAELKHELGMAADHRYNKLDKSFENWHNLDHYLFYFPNQGKFLSPLSPYYRYPMVPATVAGGKGVFCTIPPKGTITGGLAEVITVTPLAANESMDKISAGVVFNEDMEATVDISYAYTGYESAETRTKLLTEAKDKEKEIVKKVISFAGKREDIVKYTISNEDILSYNTNKPLEITATVNAPMLTEKAGPKYLFKVGEIAGTHTELYNEKKRQLPVDLGYPSTMVRTITVKIPKGYKVTNPEAIKLHAEYVDKNLKQLMSFNADYKLTEDKKKGDVLVINVKEYYPQMHFAVADFDRFKEVVNTAADFSKVMLLIEKRNGGSIKTKSKPVAKK